MLEVKSNKARLSQSDFIRNLIRDYKNDEQSQINIKNIAKIISDNINDLLKLKGKLHYLGYFREEEFLQDKISAINSLLANIEN